MSKEKNKKKGFFENMRPEVKLVVFIFSIMIATFLVYSAFINDPASNSHRNTPEINYSPDLIEMAEKGEIAIASVGSGIVKVHTQQGKTMTAIIPPGADIASDLPGIPLEVSQPPGRGFPFSFLFFTIIIAGGIIFFLSRNAAKTSALEKFGKNNNCEYEPGKNSVLFSDVAGIEEEKQELAEIVDFLKVPERYDHIGAKLPKGVLLVGPAGTGKTLLARAVAGEAGVPFFSVSGSEFMEMFVGVGASRIRDLFKKAEQKAPCVVFIDEIDAVGRRRGSGLGGGHDEREQTLNQLLVAMDGFSVNKGIVVLAATNRPDILDTALLRPGRFDRKVTVQPPDLKGRQKILEVHAKNKPFADEVKFKDLAQRTPGFTGADLANLLNESALLAARRRKKEIGIEETEEASDRILAGLEKKNRTVTEEELRIASWHEAGHALVAHVLPLADAVRKVSIVPRGNAGGYTQMLPSTERTYITKGMLKDRIATLLAGRVAEEEFLGDVSTGARNDLERATSVARSMVLEYGMSEEMGLLSYAGREGIDALSSKEADRAARKIIEECRKKALEVLKGYYKALEVLVKELREKEVLDGEDVKRIVG